MFYLASRIVTAISAFLYPGYASYKTLSQRPCSETELEHWLMYWSVLGCIVSVEYVAEWLVSWIPFYYVLKSLFLLFLALPQTQGSTYIYRNHLEPFFRAHESTIDARLGELRQNVYSFAQDKLRVIWEQISSIISLSQAQTTTPATQPGGTVPTGAAGAPPTLGNPVSAPVQMLSGLWTAYGPTIVASGAALLRQAQQSTTSATGSTIPTPGTMPRANSSQSVLERRRQLQAELDALAAHNDHDSAPSALTPTANNQPSRSRDSSDSDLRSRSRAGFEEIKVPSDTEGYDVGEGFVPPKGSAGGRRSSGWFGWGSGQPEKDGYDRLKDE